MNIYLPIIFLLVPVVSGEIDYENHFNSHEMPHQTWLKIFTINVLCQLWLLKAEEQGGRDTICMQSLAFNKDLVGPQFFLFAFILQIQFVFKLGVQ